jgi:hypothetical protein
MVTLKHRHASRRRVVLALSGVALTGAGFAVTERSMAQPAPAEGSAAFDALKRALRALEEARPERFEAQLDKGMVGYGAFVQYATDLSAKLKDVRFLLKDQQILATKDATVITAQWERRALVLPKLTPELRSGRASFLLRRSGNDWLLAGVAGDNLFKL